MGGYIKMTMKHDPCPARCSG
jgi:hypothetical protein